MGIFNRKVSQDEIKVAVESALEEYRASNELPIVGSPYATINARNLRGNEHGIAVDRALGLAAAFRAVTILGTDVSQLGLSVLRKGKEVKLGSNHLVVKPNIDISRPAFLEQTTVSLATHGNAYWRIHRDNESPTGKVTNLEVLDPAQMTIERDNGKKKYRYMGRVYHDWQIKHLSHTRLAGYEYGVGPLQAAQNELRGAIDLRNYADNWFTDSGVPSGVLSTDKTLAPGKAGEYVDAFETQTANGRTVALGDGVKYNPIYLSPEQAQFIQSQQFSVTQIARIFGIPAIFMMTDPGSSMTYQNSSDVEMQYLKHTLMRYTVEIEAAFTDLIASGQEVKFKYDDFLRPDISTRYEAYKVALDSGFMTVNEVRELEGLLPIENSVKDATPVANENDNE